MTFIEAALREINRQLARVSKPGAPPLVATDYREVSGGRFGPAVEVVVGDITHTVYVNHRRVGWRLDMARALARSVSKHTAP